MNVILYCRLASENETSSLDMEQQLNILKMYAQNKNYNIVDIITEYGSALNYERNGIVKIKELIENNNIDAIIVKDISRISRNMEDTYQFINYLRNKNILLISAQQDIDYTNKMENDIFKSIK